MSLITIAAYRRFSCRFSGLNVKSMTTSQSVHAQPFITPADLRRLSEAVAERGIVGLDADLPQILCAARAAHAPTVLPDVLASTTEPEVARIRAFVKLGMFLTTV